MAHQGPAGVQLIDRRGMNRRGAVTALEERDVIHALRQMRHQVGDPLAAVAMALEFPRRWQQARIALGELAGELAKAFGQRLAAPFFQFQLGVKQIERRRPADHEHKDDRLGLALEVGLSRRQGIGRGRAASLLLQESRQRQAAESPAGLEEKIPAIRHGGDV